MRFLTSLLTAFAAVLVLVAVPPATQAQHAPGSSSDRQHHRSDRAYHRGMSY